ncbi:MAG: tRNA lysidine(34) synthetase TilS [Pseudomonadota bacterium]
MARADTPLTAAAFASRLKALHAGPRIAVAFSGGADSLALLILASQWAAKSRNRYVIAYTVDHGLRKASAAEARQCAAVAKSLGVTHRILRWKGDKPSSGIQAAARDARYDLLVKACQRDKITTYLTAHHLEDQAETFLLRLARGSGVDGLAAMSATSQPESGLRRLRPFLDVPRETLRAVVARAGLSAIEDPSNDNPRFDRVKVRRLMSDLASIGLTPARLADTAAHMSRARKALEAATRDVLKSSVVEPVGFIHIDIAVLLASPEEIALRALAEILETVGGTHYAPRFEGLSAIYAALGADALGKARTLNGCRLVVTRGRLYVTREVSVAMRAVPVAVRRRVARLWDERFTVMLDRDLPLSAAPHEIRALGPEGLRIVRAAGCPEPAGPKSVLPTLPALWQGKRLVAAPHVAYRDGPVGFAVHFLSGGSFPSP